MVVLTTLYLLFSFFSTPTTQKGNGTKHLKLILFRLNFKHNEEKVWSISVIGKFTSYAFHGIRFSNPETIKLFLCKRY